jgi:hypothetical protein
MATFEGIITNDTELHQRIMHLNYLKEEQELLIKRNVREIAYSLQPSMVIKKIIKNFSDDNEATDDLKSMGLSLGRDFLIMKLFGKGGTLKGFISSLLAKKATDYVINNHSDLLTKGLAKLGDYFQDLRSGPLKETN